MAVAAGWLARGSRTQVVEFLEMTMDTLVGTVDADGWSQMLVAVCEEQAERCSENSDNSDGTQWYQ